MSKKKSREQNIIIMAQSLGIAGIHAGSKSTTKLLNQIQRVQAAATQTAHYELLAKKREEWKKLSAEEKEKFLADKMEERRKSRQMKKSDKPAEKKYAKKVVKTVPKYIAKRSKKNVRTLKDVLSKR